MIGQYFDKTYLINIPHRETRRIQSLLECEKVGLDPFVFPAIDGFKEQTPYQNPRNIPAIQWNHGAAALNLTTIKLLEDAKRNKYRSVLILEDDIEFHPQINMIVDEYIDGIPEDWEMIQFGCVHKQTPEKVTYRVFRIRQADCLHCYAIRDTAYDLMIEEILKMNQPLDWITQYKIQPRGRSYCILPNFAYQRAEYSDIAQMNVNYVFLK
ncbi:MAG TPA: glycosyltransferase family 25 protein [Cytophagaceae bacterium]|jgi:hypothetical protein|nr:glycosyltransferase family 25 protein [Cytophagaceae bacterium]